LNRKNLTVAAILLIALISISLFLTLNSSNKTTPTRPFYLGVEFAYGNQYEQVKALVDKVKDYTNLLVLGSPGLTFNRTALDESVDYIYTAGLSFIVLFTSSTMYNQSNGYPENDSIFDWMIKTKQTYGDKFLGIYRFDEPGGNQLDNGQYQLIDNGASYTQIGQNYVGNLSIIINYYLVHGAPQIFTSDYGLYWFDYRSNYTTIFGEFVGNQSRERIIALDRGAAESFNKDWGVIINWKYNQAPYLENGTELYSDLTLAYDAGANYAVVFSFPNTTSYGTLSDDHFVALQTFWNNIHNNPSSFVSSKAEVAYIIPTDYGFGFRNPSDTIWGLFPSDAASSKIWNDTTLLISKYGTNINIIYDEPEIIGPTLNNYIKVLYWNQTIT
jgi:hypothetical protein